MQLPQCQCLSARDRELRAFLTPQPVGVSNLAPQAWKPKDRLSMLMRALLKDPLGTRLTLREWARRAGLHDEVPGAVLAGKRPDIPLSKAQRLADALGIGLDTLVGAIVVCRMLRAALPPVTGVRRARAGASGGEPVAMVARGMTGVAQGRREGAILPHEAVVVLGEGAAQSTTGKRPCAGPRLPPARGKVEG